MPGTLRGCHGAINALLKGVTRATATLQPPLSEAVHRCHQNEKGGKTRMFDSTEPSTARLKSMFLKPLENHQTLRESSILKWDLILEGCCNLVHRPFNMGKMQDTVKPCVKMAPLVLVWTGPRESETQQRRQLSEGEICVSCGSADT